MSSQFRLVASVTTPQELADALNMRRIELGLSMNDVDHVIGLAHGYASKIFAKNYPKNLGRMSLPVMLEAFGLRLAVVAATSEEALPPITRRVVKERAKMERPVAVLMPRGTRAEQAARRQEQTNI